MLRKIGFFLPILTIMFAFNLNVSAQKANISFDAKDYDFGEIKEADGSATHVFEFTNTGDAPLIIQRVNASCGCTSPDWTKTPVEPGKKGIVSATYNPVGRPGSFNKTISVYSNSVNEVVHLTIKGNVISKTSAPGVKANNSSSDYPIEMGELRISSKTAQLGNIYQGNTQSYEFKIKNTTSSEQQISLSGLPGYIAAEITPKLLRANETGKIKLSFDSKKCSEWGPINESTYVVLNNNKQLNDVYKLTLTANVVEDFSKQSSAQKKLSPIVEIKSPNLEFGKIKKGSKVKGKISIKNVGSNPLEIRRIINNSSDVTINPLRDTIKSGKTGTLNVFIDTKYLPQGEQKKTFSVLTNDPVNSVIVYNLSFTVL